MHGYSVQGEMLKGRVKIRQAFFNEEDAEALLKEVNTKSSVQGREIKFKQRDGSVGWQEFSMLVKRNEAGEVIGYEGIVRDITKRKRAEGIHLQAERCLPRRVLPPHVP